MTSLAAIGAGFAHGWMADVSQAASGSLMAAVWQGVLLAAVAGLGLRLLPKTPAAVRFAIWFGVFLLVTALPVISLLPHAAAAAQPRVAWFTLDARWSLAIAAIWAIASLVRAGTLTVAALRVRALWKRATPVEVETVSLVDPIHNQEAETDGIPKLSGAKRPAQLCTSEEIDRPTVIGFFSPKILIPRWLLGKLTPVELEQIVLHESGHLGRADDWVNLLQKIALVVFPLNPALAWVERRLCFERELACDEWVLRAFAGRPGAPTAYAACLATVAEHRLQRRGVVQGLALALGALGRESELGRRVSRILRREERMKPAHAKMVLGGAMLGLLAAAAGLERSPQVVGFAPAEQSAALTEPARAIVARVSGLRYQPVVFHPNAAGTERKAGVTAKPAIKLPVPSHPQPVIGSPQETLLKASLPSGRSNGVAEGAGLAQRSPNETSSRSVRLVRTAVAQAQASQEADGVVTRWVVVTSWRDADGSRVVLTTSDVSSGAAGQTPTAQPGDLQEVYPYAAVPVRGGWLVFQL